jgi:hypothetical protein
MTSVDNSSKQMQQTSGSSFSNRTDDETDGDKSAVDEVPVVVFSFLLMVCGNCDQSFR